MDQLPAVVMRANVAKWAVPPRCVPAVTAAMLAVPALTYEPWDMTFQGQDLTTTYFDTPCFALRQARAHADQYLTLRIRCYQPPGDQPEIYALGVKTEQVKLRVEVDPLTAVAVLQGAMPMQALASGALPADLLARLQQLAADEPLVPVVCVHSHRYTVGDDDDRLTLDTQVHTDKGQRLPYAVLEFKSMDPETPPPGRLGGLAIRPARISKFLWATGV